MTHLPALLSHSFRRFRGLVLAIGGFLAAFQILFSLAAVTLDRSGSFEPLAAIIPAPIREALGPGMMSMVSITGITFLGYFHIAVMGVLVGMMIAIATEPAAEIETRFIDLVLAHPLHRYTPIVRSFLLCGAAAVITLTIMAAGTITGILWLAPREAAGPALRLVPLLSVNLAALMMSWGGVALALSAFARRRAFPAAAAAILAMSSYLTDYLARIWEPAREVAWMCPFHYYSAVQIIGSGSLPMKDVWTLLAIAAAGFVVAAVTFSRRDL